MHLTFYYNQININLASFDYEQFKICKLSEKIIIQCFGFIFIKEYLLLLTNRPFLTKTLIFKVFQTTKSCCWKCVPRVFVHGT